MSERPPSIHDDPRDQDEGVLLMRLLAAASLGLVDEGAMNELLRRWGMLEPAN